ncbi:calcium and integrin-binding protein 1-like [Ptychodera flava]|uniref:calcium and integrin-binding protein 1-like n=1 Tax=Ptychodera flava TaxID=63121 RepID=UPI003969BD27
MGSWSSKLTKGELDDYEELTYLSKAEILHVFDRFSELDPETVENNRKAILSMDTILKLPELQCNPFKDRICKVFSTQGDGGMNFEDFLDMISVFSDSAPMQVKIEYAFRIYDFNEDDLVDESDIREMVRRITASSEENEQRLTENEMKLLIDNIFSETDLDDDRKLTFAEFSHVISRSPDFMRSFRIKL